MGKVRNIVRNIDGVELRTAMLFLWVSVFCFFGFVLALSWPGLAFADIACLLFFLITLVEGLTWVRKAFVAHYADSETERVKYVNEEEESEPGCQYTQDELDQIQEAHDFIYAFFHQQETGEGTWKKKGMAVKQYQGWLNVFRQLKMVDVRTGAAPRPLVGYNQALEMIANRYVGDPDYFRWVKRYRISYPANAKVVNEASPLPDKPLPTSSASTSTSTARSKVEVEL